jgi:hypothetical protein
MTIWTPSQQAALNEFDRFLQDDHQRPIMIVRGAAGTGKSTVISEFARRAELSGLHAVLLAPTGRAARVLQQHTKQSAGTIHGCIYNLSELREQTGETEQPVLRFELKKSADLVNTVFIVDEASMVGNRESFDENLRFGSGKLLTDLLHYVFHDHPDGRRKLVFVGDHCQLPPIGDTASPALDRESLRQIASANIYEAELTDILRQLAGSALIQQAHALRSAIVGKRYDSLIWNSGADLQLHEDSESFFAAYQASIQQLGRPHLVCFRNVTVQDWNQRIREEAFRRDPDIEPGDLLVVQRNHLKSGLRNGDFVRVLELGKRIERPFKKVLLVFREAVLGEEERSEIMHECLILENQLLSPERNLSSEEEQARWVLFKMDYAQLFRSQTQSGELPMGQEITLTSRDQSEKYLPTSIKEALQTDPFWNALQVRYGYATTCHKAQGGEWEEVFVHCDRGSRGGLHSNDFFRWLYTAVTRSKVRLHILDAPSFRPWDGLVPGADNARPQDQTVTQQKPAPQAMDFASLVKEAIRQAVKDRNARMVDLDVKPFLFRVRVEAGDQCAQFDLHYSGKQELRSLNWNSETPLFHLGELQARMLSLHSSPVDREDFPIGVIETMDRLERFASEDELELHWESKPYQLILKVVDPSCLTNGVCEASFFYKKDGRLSNLQFKPAADELKKRARRLFNRLGEVE